MEYPKTLDAVARAEVGLWPVVEALVEELETTPGGSVRNGEYAKAAKYLEENGYRTWSAVRLQKFRSLGGWVESCRLATRFKKYPVELVMEARAYAKSNEAAALKKLESVKSKRDIRPDRISATQIVEALTEPSMRAEVISTTEGISVIERAHLDVRAKAARTPDDEMKIPPASRFAGAFWRAVAAIRTAHKEMDSGLGTLDLDDIEVRTAAVGLRMQASEIEAAIAEAVVERSITQEV